MFKLKPLMRFSLDNVDIQKQIPFLFNIHATHWLCEYAATRINVQFCRDGILLLHKKLG